MDSDKVKAFLGKSSRWKTPNLLSATLVSLAIGFAGSAVGAQDFDKGLAAAERGDYASALAEWRPLAEQGYSGPRCPSSNDLEHERLIGLRRIRLAVVSILCRVLSMQQAAFLDCLVFDLLSASEDGFSPTEVDIGGCQVAEALVVSVVVVMIDEVADGLFERSWQVVVFQQDAVLQGLVPSLDLALCLRVVWALPRT